MLTFTVLGPLALPLVWRSPLMGRRTKWLLSVVILIATALAAYACWKTGVAVVDAWNMVVSEFGGLSTL